MVKMGSASQSFPLFPLWTRAAWLRTRWVSPAKHARNALFPRETPQSAYRRRERTLARRSRHPLHRFRGAIGWFLRCDDVRAEALHQSRGLVFTATGHEHSERVIPVGAMDEPFATKVKDGWLRCHAYVL